MWTGNGSKWSGKGKERQGEWKSVYNTENLRRLRGAAKGGAGGTEDKRFLVSINNIHVCQGGRMRAAWKCKQKYLQRRQGFNTENGEKIKENTKGCTSQRQLEKEALRIKDRDETKT